MRYIEADGTRLSVVGLGTWQFGSREWRYGGDYARHDAIAITERALALGVNMLDTAEIYGFGRSERIIGAAIRGRREEAFIATKLFPVFPIAPVVVWRATRSARRLAVERLDLYQVHAPNPLVPLTSTMRGMAELHGLGRIGHVGVSNFSLAQWQRAEVALGASVISNQVRYSLAVRNAERAVLPWAQANGRLVIAYSPLAQGLLSGRYDGSNTPRDVRAKNPLFRPDMIANAAPILTAVREVAASHQATAAQIALAWLIRRPNVVAIPGARTVGQLEENVAAADIELGDEEDRFLTEASDTFHSRIGKSER